MAVISPKIGKAMATQVNRVNESPEALKQRILNLECENAVLKQRLEEISTERGEFWAELKLKPEFISASEFARRHAVAVSTITRKFHAGKLPGKKNDRGYIFIKADAVFAKYQKRS